MGGRGAKGGGKVKEGRVTGLKLTNVAELENANIDKWSDKRVNDRYIAERSQNMEFHRSRAAFMRDAPDDINVWSPALRERYDRMMSVIKISDKNVELLRQTQHMRGR